MDRTLCCFCLSFWLILVLLSLILATFIAPKPSCSLQQFYISGLNKTFNPTGNATLTFTLQLHNNDNDKGLYYDALNVTIFDSPNRSHSIGNLIIPKFYQGVGKTATKGGKLQISEADRESLYRAISFNPATTVLKLDLVTSIRRKILSSMKGLRQNIKVGADVEVNRRGSRSYFDDLQLKSPANTVGICPRQLWILLVANFMALHALA